jgi:hypothetical protein
MVRELSTVVGKLMSKTIQLGHGQLDFRGINERHARALLMKVFQRGKLGLPLDALGVYLPGKLRADNFLLYFRIYGACIWFPSLKLGGCI